MTKIVNVCPLDNYEILLEFNNGEKRIKDMKPYLDKGIFSKLKDKKFFEKVKISFGTISWDSEIEMDAEKLYDTSKKIDQ